MALILFDDVFEVKDINKDGRKYDNVSRLHCTSDHLEMDLVIDINTEIFPISINDKFKLVLASSLNLDGTPDEGIFDQSKKKTLLDQYEYAMHGKVFKFSTEKAPSSQVSVYVSFGGLLMSLQGEPRNLQGVELDSRLYALMKKIEKA
mmetsp:Transcript_14260/g.36486  ORF Transcript_14260/g.36486 Transcript_14260/m.36486 type:complete len:148 (-) Transcript_14260:100-543(-)